MTHREVAVTDGVFVVPSLSSFVLACLFKGQTSAVKTAPVSNGTLAAAEKQTLLLS